FQMEKYPGTNSASSYASEVTIMDSNKKPFDYRIYMNHVLDYKGYRFFQSSYDVDEQGTVLSVNHDFWGTLITYIGYFLLAMGMFFTLFWKGSRFSDLSKKISNLNNNKAGLLILLLSLSLNISAQNTSQDTVVNDTITHTADDGHNHSVNENPEFLSKPVSKEHAAKFGRLVVQDHQGRTKPVNTYALEALRKIYKKDSFEGLTAEQVILSMQLDPYYWAEKYLIHVKTNTLGKKISSDIQVIDGNTALSKLYGSGTYYFGETLEKVMLKRNIDRNSTDKEIINLDERVNVLVSIFNGNLIQIYPKEGDKNNKWYSGFDQDLIATQDTAIAVMHQNYLLSLVKAVQTGDYSEADNNLENIRKYQLKYGADIMPSARKIDLEIKYNQWNIFKKLMMYYMMIGFIFLILAFIDLFTDKIKLVKSLLKLFTVLTILAMLLHAIGLGVRWYISGHAPWSNGYEAVVFVAFVSILAGLIFSYKKSKFVLASTVIFASFLLGIAHGSMMNPEITNLVPVLKSYWL
ncbi:MAG: cytochrome c biogenesis protein ResB, partial [Epsilonproteobacteria bacterium]|nr:cytochrome c biogenesis protein ResB [Campylobacterota bacterium]